VFALAVGLAGGARASTVSLVGSVAATDTINWTTIQGVTPNPTTPFTFLTTGGKTVVATIVAETSMQFVTGTPDAGQDFQNTLNVNSLGAPVDPPNELLPHLTFDFGLNNLYSAVGFNILANAASGNGYSFELHVFNNSGTEILTGGSPAFLTAIGPANLSGFPGPIFVGIASTAQDIRSIQLFPHFTGPAPATAETFELGNLSLQGTAAAVPEPGTLGSILLVASAMLAYVRLRRR